MCGHNGLGVLVTLDDPSPPSVSLSPGHYTYIDPCPCVEGGECPWCGSPVVMEEPDTLFDYGEKSTLKCSGDPSVCGWTWTYACEHSSDPRDGEDYSFPSTWSPFWTKELP